MKNENSDVDIQNRIFQISQTQITLVPKQQKKTF